jgi:transcriptional regulator with XRE-family HTH domain
MAEVTNLWKVIQHWMDQQRFPPNQSTLAKAVGVQRSAVSDWKTGKSRPSPAHMRALADIMEPTLGPKTYTVLVMAMTADMGFGDWTLGAEKNLPEGAYLEYTGGDTYGVFHGLVPDDGTAQAPHEASDETG